MRQLRDLNIEAHLEILELDVTRDDQIDQAADFIATKYGKLDGPSPTPLLQAHSLIVVVLINNAAIATIPEPNCSTADFRVSYNDTFNTNITSVATLTTALIPLLRKSPDPRVINVSSGRASMHALTTGTLPPTVSVAYSVSKLALNVLMLEKAKQEEQVQGSKILYQAVNPGHCKTALNGFRGQRDPVEGAKVVEEMITCERGKYEVGFWEWEGDEESGEVQSVPW
jgi:NAD(P)-dependent dehydrogenase (short-subunit alcohol dehydrogenase family)